MNKKNKNNDKISKQIYTSELLLSHLSEIINTPVDENTQIHLAIFIEPYLQYIIEGKKTLESRFSVHRIAPFKRIFKGDLILLKKSSGPIIGFCLVEDVWFYQLNPSVLNEIRNKFGSALCVQDPQFWVSKKHTSYATLIKLGAFISFSPIKFQKKDRRGWVVLKPKAKEREQLSLGEWL